jgi:hypothetical protein
MAEDPDYRITTDPAICDGEDCPVGFDCCQGAVKAARSGERAADSVNVPEVDWREGEIARDWGGTEIIR